MSSAAWPLVLQLIRRGIHVLCEHPYPADTLKRGMNLARETWRAVSRERTFRKSASSASVHSRLPAGHEGGASRVRRGDGHGAIAIRSPRHSDGSHGQPSSSSGSCREPAREVCAAGRNAGEGSGPCLCAGLGQEGQRQVGGWKSRLSAGPAAHGGIPAGLLTLLSAAGPVLWNSTPAHVHNEKPLWTMLCGQATQTLADARGAENPGER